jgi:hypothetical protein
MIIESLRYLTQVNMKRGFTTEYENVLQLGLAAYPKVARNWCFEPEPKSDQDVCKHHRLLPT